MPHNAYVLVGCGGIGYNCAELLVRMLRNLPAATLYLVDGDRVETSNMARQFGETDIGHYKADSLASHLSRRLLTESDTLEIIASTLFLDYGNIAAQPWMKADTLTVFSGVDNDATRILLEESIQDRDEVTLLSAGNGFEDGQAVLFRRRDGQNVDPLPSEIDPEILSNDGMLPSQIPCDQVVQSAPQQVLANALAGISMLTLWYAKCLRSKPRHEQAFNYVTFDAAAPHLSPFVRPALVAHSKGAAL